MIKFIIDEFNVLRFEYEYHLPVDFTGLL